MQGTQGPKLHFQYHQVPLEQSPGDEQKMDHDNLLVHILVELLESTAWPFLKLVKDTPDDPQTGSLDGLVWMVKMQHPLV